MRKRKPSDTLTGYLYILPNFIGFLIFTWIPIIMCLGMSFTNYDGFQKPEFIGLGNYAKLIKDESFIISLENNLIFTGISVPLTIVIALGLAILVRSIMKGSTLFRTIFFFPHITSFVAVAIVWSMMFHPQNGMVNNILMSIGIHNPPEWLVSSQWALFAIIIVMVWKSSGYYMILFISGLQSIPSQLYESAEIDGASKIKQFMYVTLPMLSPTMLFVIITLLINSFQIFDIVNIMTEGGPGRSTNVLVYRIYLEAYKYFKFGYASAISVVLFMIAMIITGILFKSQKKWVTYMQ